MLITLSLFDYDKNFHALRNCRWNQDKRAVWSLAPHLVCTVNKYNNVNRNKQTGACAYPVIADIS